MDQTVRVASIQIAPVFLDAAKTWAKLSGYIREAHANGAKLITWSETLIPGYPLWVWMPSPGPSPPPFPAEEEKMMYAKYWRESIDIATSPIVDEMKQLSLELKVKLMGGVAEKEASCNSSVYCTLLTIGDGRVIGKHRKLKPTFKERLIWADGHGQSQLETYPLFDGDASEADQFFFGGLNCWENLIPYARSALHMQNEVVHVAAWPGTHVTTQDCSKFMAMEGRSWVVSSCGLLRVQDCEDVDADVPSVMKKMITDTSQTENNSGVWMDGGSVIINPKGEIVSGPLVAEEGILYADVDPWMAVRERYNFDYSGHYSRFDVFNKPITKQKKNKNAPPTDADEENEKQETGVDA